ncbi:MAG: tetratricopeptide repeat protein [Gammaproteobacteria bacterium]|nr:tetratricopeptide repeat protein [Gammaproteobacteria bacterium]
MKFVYYLLALLLMWISAGCTTTPETDDGMLPMPRELEQPQVPVQETPGVRAPSRSNSAVASILLDVQSAIQAGRYSVAASQLERALRIEPANARVWHYLARVRFNQRRYAQAANLAAKSNALARGDEALRAQNDALIDASRRAMP